MGHTSCCCLGKNLYRHILTTCSVSGFTKLCSWATTARPMDGYVEIHPRTHTLGKWGSGSKARALATHSDEAVNVNDTRSRLKNTYHNTVESLTSSCLCLYPAQNRCRSESNAEGIHIHRTQINITENS